MTADDEQLTALRQRFLEDAAATCKPLREALERGDQELLRHAAHRLAGRAGMFGYPLVSEAAQHLEEAVAAGGAAEEVARLCGELLARLRRLDLQDARDDA